VYVDLLQIRIAVMTVYFALNCAILDRPKSNASDHAANTNGGCERYLLVFEQ